jgi:hypothetical protein
MGANLLLFLPDANPMGVNLPFFVQMYMSKSNGKEADSDLAQFAGQVLHCVDEAVSRWLEKSEENGVPRLSFVYLSVIIRVTHWCARCFHGCVMLSLNADE